MAIYIVSGLVEGQWNNVVAERWTHAQIRQLLVVFGISVVALLANPYGYKLVLYPFDLQFRQKAILGSMAEWQSVDFHVGWGKLAMFMVLSLLAAAWFSREHWMLRDILASAFALWASLTHLRFLLFAAIILVPLGLRLQLFPAYDAKKDKLAVKPGDDGCHRGHHAVGLPERRTTAKHHRHAISPRCPAFYAAETDYRPPVPSC